MIDSIDDAGTNLSAFRLLGTRLILRRFIDRLIGCVTYYHNEAAYGLRFCPVFAPASVALEAK